MERWKQSLDRYLTSEPPDDYTPWVESVAEELYKIDEGYDAEGSFLDSEVGWKILNYLNLKGYTPKESALLIYKTFPK